MKVRVCCCCLRLCLPTVQHYLGEKLLKAPYEDVSLLLDELLTAELQVSVHILLRVNVVLLYLRCSLRARAEWASALSNGVCL